MLVSVLGRLLRDANAPVSGVAIGARGLPGARAHFSSCVVEHVPCCSRPSGGLAESVAAMFVVLPRQT